MLSTLRNAWKVPDLRKRIIFTVLMLAIYRMGNFIPVPGIDTAALSDISKSGTLFGFYDLISGGAFSRFSIFAMGVIPYINASIIMQLLTIAIPQLEQLSKEGEEGRKKIQNIVRYSAVALGVLQAFGTYALMTSQVGLRSASGSNLFVIILTLVTASTFLIWLGDQITVKGIGNGISMLIFVNIISRVPTMVAQIAGLQEANNVNFVEVVMFIAIALVLLAVVVIVSLAERRIPVQYAGRQVGNKSYKGQSTHIPISITSSAVIAIIFAMSVMNFPATIGSFFPTSAFNKFVTMNKFSPFEANTWKYAILYAVLTLFFTWFYTQITFKPDEMAENMHKSSGFIPGIRPGESTARYLERILGKIAILGGLFAALIAVFPILLEGYSDFKGIAFGGTGLLIVVGVALESMKQLQAQLVMRHYEGFLK